MDARSLSLQDIITGCLLGTAVGDAIGLPAEGLSRARIGRLYPHLNEHHFLRGRGMISDDTEHTILVAQALTASGGDSAAFAASLARQLKTWFLMLPGGVGLATAKACVRLLLGLSPDKSGVHSAGNGPAMRSALIGVCCGKDPARMRHLVRVSTRITHTDPRAEHGALAVALAAYLSAYDPTPEEYCEALQQLLKSEGEELVGLVVKASLSASQGNSTESFAKEIGQGGGVSGYINATVPVVLHAWFSHPHDYREAVRSVIACGGDTDTTAAILGAIIGGGVGKAGIPKDWLVGVREWPRDVPWMERLGARLAQAIESGTTQPPLDARRGQFLRNLLFLAIVLLHGFRRLLPPY